MKKAINFLSKSLSYPKLNIYLNPSKEKESINVP
jgi:hypothetical protein